MKNIIITCIILASSVRIWGQTSVNPADVIAGLHQSMRDALDFTAETSQTSWLSLSTVGTSIPDQSVIDNIGDLAPSTSPFMQSFQYGRKLHLRYQDIINLTVGPIRDYSQNYKKAKAELWTDASETTMTAKYAKYREYQIKDRQLQSQIIKETNPQIKESLIQERSDLGTDWVDMGHRGLIDNALAVTRAEEYAQGGTLRNLRNKLVEDYLKDKNGNAVLTPTSGLAIAPADWAAASGWTSFKFTHDQTVKQSTFNEKIKSAAGGFHLGFVTFGGSGGTTESTEKKFTKLSKLSYAYEVLKVEINRPWLERSVFFEGKSYTWSSKPTSHDAKYPLIADRTDPAGMLSTPLATTVSGKDIVCPLLPASIVVAKNMVVTATVSKSDWSNVLNKGQVSGGGVLFGIFGGKAAATWTTNVINEDADNVTFEVRMAGPAIVGMISSIVPRAPEPDPTLQWPTESWLP